MGQPIEITRHEFSASDLRRVAAKTGEGGWVRRLLAIALLLDGHSREAAASANGMTRQTLRDWVHRFNADGVSGLRSRTSPGRPPALTETRWEELKIIVLEGPDPERHRVVRWRRIDLCEEIAARWSVRVCEQTMGKWLRQLGMTRLQPRPYHPKKDLEAEVAFKKRMARPVRKRFLRSDLSSLRQRIRPMGIALAKMEIRASSVLINFTASSAIFLTRVPGRRSTVRPSRFHHQQTSVAEQHPVLLGRSQLRRRLDGRGVELFAAPQHDPHDPRQLVRQRNHGGILVHALHQPAQPAAERRGTRRQRWQSRPRAVDQQLAQVLVATFGDADETWLAAGRDLARHQPEPRRKIASASEGLAVADRGQQCRCIQHTDAGNGRQTPRVRVAARAVLANSSSNAAMRRSSSRHSARMSSISRRIRGLSE